MREADSVAQASDPGWSGVAPWNPTAPIAVSRSVRHRRVGDEVVVLHLERGLYHGLEGVAAQAWSLLDTIPTLNELVDRLHEEYEVDAGTLRRDLSRFLTELEEHDLVTVDDRGPR